MRRLSHSGCVVSTFAVAQMQAANPGSKIAAVKDRGTDGIVDDLAKGRHDQVAVTGARGGSMTFLASAEDRSDVGLRGL